MDNVFDYFDKTHKDVRDEIIPLKVCNEHYGDEWNKDFKVYCPDFRESDFMFGDASS